MNQKETGAYTRLLPGSAAHWTAEDRAIAERNKARTGDKLLAATYRRDDAIDAECMRAMTIFNAPALVRRYDKMSE